MAPAPLALSKAKHADLVAARPGMANGLFGVLVVMRHLVLDMKCASNEIASSLGGELLAPPAHLTGAL